MKTIPLLNSQLLARVLLKSLAILVVIVLVNPLVFTYYGLRPPSWRFQLVLATINFPLIALILATVDWLKRARDAWGVAERRRFIIIMVCLASFFFSLAAFLYFYR